MSSSHCKLPVVVSFSWSVFLSCQQQLSQRTLVRVCHPWIWDLASLGLVTDSPERLGIPPGCSGHRLLAASSVAFGADADNWRRNSFRLMPFSCPTCPVQLMEASRLLVAPRALRPPLQEGGLEASVFGIAKEVRSCGGS